MFDFFEQPLTLVGLAVIVLFGMFTFRSVFPEKRRWWQLLIPVLVAGAGFGLDLLVATDLEKINVKDRPTKKEAKDVRKLITGYLEIHQELKGRLRQELISKREILRNYLKTDNRKCLRYHNNAQASLIRPR